MKKQNPYLRMFHKTAAVLLALTMLFTSLLSGCGKQKSIDCPFTDLGWESSVAELFEAEGACDEPYKSAYGGVVYTYPSVYMDHEGTVQYMYDENNVLMSVAFSYGSEDAEELKAFYDTLVSDIEKEYGDSTYTTDETMNYGKVWELKEGNIILSVMLTDSSKTLQIAYINPLAQEEED